MFCCKDNFISSSFKSFRLSNIGFTMEILSHDEHNTLHVFKPRYTVYLTEKGPEIVNLKYIQKLLRNETVIMTIKSQKKPIKTSETAMKIVISE